MADQIDVIEDLVETLEDGKEGFSRVAEKLREDGHGDLADKMTEFSEQRARFAGELRTYAANAGVEIDEEGSAGGALHRGWISVKDALTGDDPHAVLAAAEEGEDHAVEEYEDALEEEGLSDDLRDLISRQAADVKSAHDEVRNLRDRFEG
jgi:uncharacterized protein (TIGR02284 family)